ncbi:MAG TPA: serine/threonine protein kinase [Candidatus Bathyarchaeia archaeon]|nr:serine/threonine protein kinase [Candidatus Bathyarchaeia archaeon]
MKSSTIVPLNQLIQEPYASVLCFPNPSEPELQSRLAELGSLGVSAIEFSGSASLFGVRVPVLGKGFVGVVVVAPLNGVRVALKIRRTDADRGDLLHEARMLSVANSAGVGPKLVAASKNFLLMQLIDGGLITDWLETNKHAAMVKQVLGEVLEQCFRLDRAGLDHGELSKAPKHLLVDKAQKPFIVDFETASVERRVANVTAVCQYLFAGNSSASKLLAEIFGEKERLDLIDVLKTYKKNRTRENFEGLLEVCLS